MNELEVFACYPDLNTLYRDDKGQLWTEHETARQQSASGEVETVNRATQKKKTKPETTETNQ